MIRIFIICVLNTYDINKQICKFHGLQEVKDENF